jgi:hypothetical protein
MGKQELLRNFNSLEGAYRSMIRDHQTNNLHQL